MVFGPEHGLAEAFRVFDKLEMKKKENPDYQLDFEKGILQAIGYKEFYRLYQFLKENNPDELKSYENLHKESISPVQESLNYPLSNYASEGKAAAAEKDATQE